jgi:hypothetical protein
MSMKDDDTLLRLPHAELVAVMELTDQDIEMCMTLRCRVVENIDKLDHHSKLADLFSHMHPCVKTWMRLLTTKLSILRDEYLPDRRLLVDFHQLGLPAAFSESYVPRKIAPDGNCFYRAVSLSLFGTVENHELIRTACLVKLADMAAEIDRVLKKTDSTSFKECVRVIATLGKWSHDVSPILVSAIFKRSVVIVSHLTSSGLERLREASFQEVREAMDSGPFSFSATAYLAHQGDRMEQPIVLHFDHTRKHYTALIKRSHACPDLIVKEDQRFVIYSWNTCF